MRVIYTFCVAGNRAILQWITTSGNGAESTLLQEACKANSQIAYFSLVFDGWNRTHRDVAKAVLKRFPKLTDHWDELDRQEWTVIPFKALESTGSDTRRPRVRSTRALNNYARQAFIQSFEAGVDFATAIEGFMLIHARVTGPSIDDHDFRRSKRNM